MNPAGESADQMVKMTLQGIEAAARISGSAARTLASVLYGLLREKKRVRGRARISDMLEQGRELKVFALHENDLKIFCREARKYGVLYCVLKEKDLHDGICDILVSEEDAPRVSRIIERFELAALDTDSIRKEILERRNSSPPVKTSKEEIETYLKETKELPLKNRTERDGPLSGRDSPSSGIASSRPSVRREIERLRSQSQRSVNRKDPFQQRGESRQ
ncbi:MAG: PcfB family protein [Erysipelotrichaceae bacterium]|nr:PcfB family protein [Erysipelotrichaceae bacterium]